MFSDGLGEGKVRNGGWKATIFVDWLMNQGSSAILTRMVTARSSLGAKLEIEVTTWAGWISMIWRSKWKQPFIGSKSIVIVHISWYAPESYLEGQGISHFTWNCHTSMLRSLKMCCSWRIGTFAFSGGTTELQGTALAEYQYTEGSGWKGESKFRSFWTEFLLQ